MPESLGTLQYRVSEVEKDMAHLEERFTKRADASDAKLDSLRSVLIGLIVTIATGSTMIVLTLVLTGKAHG